MCDADTRLCISDYQKKHVGWDSHIMPKLDSGVQVGGHGKPMLSGSGLQAGWGKNKGGHLRTSPGNF